MEDKGELDPQGLGAVASVQASSIEEKIYQNIAKDSGFKENDEDVVDQSERLKGLEREIWALKSALQCENDGDADDASQGGENANTMKMMDDPLQQAVMKERLASLEGEYTELLNSVNNEIRATTGARAGKRERERSGKLMEADLFDDARPKRGGKGGSLIETERDRLIRLGVLTPFDSIGGFERRIEGEDRVKEASIADVGKRVKEMRESRRTAKLVDPSQLPRAPRQSARKVNESFWRSSSGGKQHKMKRDSVLSSIAPDHTKSGNHSDDLDDKIDARGQHDDMDEETFQKRQVAAKYSAEDTAGAQDVVFQGGYRIPEYIYSKLFDYQRTAIKWLWELHTQRAGGIMGDEMGLGKTIQVTAFLAGLHHSGLFKPSLIVCPATMLRQWLRELREWYPEFRVAILHDSARSKGSGALSRSDIVRRIASSSAGILITTYDHLRICKRELIRVKWGYAILDEGHKIRNPDAEVTLAAKQLMTVHRIILSGSPIQNRLVELWSLFDFVFPGKLGTLPVFQAQFAIPIQQGGYANASSLQVATAYKCAVVLRDMVSPYLIRRKKADVAQALPKKTERVLFCSLTNVQRDMYVSYLASKELGEILNGDRGALIGIDILRKICNHPDLLEKGAWDSTQDYGNLERSGKMLVLDKVLAHWIANEQKALVFTQTQQMLDILEKMVIQRGWTYHRMDGSTPVGTRSKLIDSFNSSSSVSLFLLTTRVGGLGINLTGASKCIIFDPDWNPSTDVQARERAWRIGQTKEVTVYRLIVSGTIEEKVYHRQVYKQFITDKVLKDPRQKRFFKAKDLSDLFTLGDEYAEGTETAAIFSSLGPTAAVNNKDDLDRLESTAKGEPSTVSEMESMGIANKAEDIVETNEHNAEEERGDAFILKELFDNSGIHSALDHDKIEGAHNPQNNIAQKEAKKIAEKAAKALQDSRRSLRSTPVTCPTWTGKSGSAGAPGQMFSGSGSGNHQNNRSSSILAKIRSRNKEAASLAVQNPDVSAGKQLAESIAAFLQSQGGSASSSSVASHFQRNAHQGPISPDLFKSLLRQVATLVRTQDGRVWKLRSEFRLT
ncbi:DNA excision repair protein CSB [Picochlorum sp. SENEW3]|nr:DNA excision repair protein CSB [Picochlorum sp. SENEW3]